MIENVIQDVIGTVQDQYIVAPFRKMMAKHFELWRIDLEIFDDPGTFAEYKKKLRRTRMCIEISIFALTVLSPIYSLITRLHTASGTWITPIIHFTLFGSMLIYSAVKSRKLLLELKVCEIIES